MSSQYRLLRERRFAPFFWTQFMGAMNDNLFKVAFTSLVTYHASLFQGLDGRSAAFLISAVFILPFVLFSATSGQLADKYDKARMIRLVKTLEIAIMLIGAAGFASHSATLLYVCTFLMGLHSTLFGPVKYAYLPQHLGERELVGGNGMVEMGTFVAILIGTILGGELAGLARGGELIGPVLVGGLCVLVALAGRLIAQGVPASPAAQPALRINWNPVSETWRNLRLAGDNRTVFLSMLGISWLWFVGATFLTSFFSFARDTLHADQDVVTLLLAVFSIGIGLGSLLCERLSGGRVELGLVPFGSIGMTAFAVDLYFASHALPAHALMSVGEFLREHAHWRVLADLLLLALFAGFYSVPLYALIQSRCEATHRARIIAANNILNALFMIASALLGLLLTSTLGLSIPELFLITGILNALVAIYIYSLVPEFLVRFVLWIVVNLGYRIRTEGLRHIPEQGAAVLVCNHVSFVDAVIIGTTSPRQIRFVMDHRIFANPLLGWLFRQVRAIPIAPAHEDPEMLERAYRTCAEALANGELVCIFPEGKITAHGELNPFKQGVRNIIDRSPAPVVPMALRGLWGSFFSRKGGAAMTRPFRRGVLSKLDLVVGEAIPHDLATPELLQERVLALRGPMS